MEIIQKFLQLEIIHKISPYFLPLRYMLTLEKNESFEFYFVKVFFVIFSSRHNFSFFWTKILLSVSKKNSQRKCSCIFQENQYALWSNFEIYFGMAFALMKLLKYFEFNGLFIQFGFKINYLFNNKSFTVKFYLSEGEIESKALFCSLSFWLSLLILFYISSSIPCHQGFNPMTSQLRVLYLNHETMAPLQPKEHWV